MTPEEEDTAPRLYTRRGDSGQTSVGGQTGNKFELLPELLGQIDELNSSLGCIIVIHPALDEDLSRIQRILMRMSSYFHGADESEGSESYASWLESEIDRISSQLPALRGFILPRGQIHVARAICRRVERRLSEFLSKSSSNDSGSDEFYFQFMNRLSDYLFVLAREHSQPDILLKEERDANEER